MNKTELSLIKEDCAQCKKPHWFLMMTMGQGKIKFALHELRLVDDLIGKLQDIQRDILADTPIMKDSV